MKNDYPKINIFINGRYRCSTTWSKTCKDAVIAYDAKYRGVNSTFKTTAHFCKGFYP